MTDDNILEPELVALGAEIRAFAPVMNEGFERELDARVAAGFPGDPKASRFHWLKTLRAPKFAGPIAIAATVLVAVVVVGLGTRGSGTDDATTSEVGVLDSATAPSGAAGATPAPQVGSAKSSDVAPTAPRKVERAANLELTTSTDDVKDVANGVVRETQAAGGYVADSSVSTSASDGDAQFTLRVPTKNLDKAIASLSKLANVGSLSQDSTDITSSYVSAGDRLADSQAERKALIKALARASTPGQIASLKQRITISRQEIATAKSEVRKLQRRADLSTVQVDVSGSGERKDAAAGWTPKDAAGDAVAILGAIAGGLIIGLAVGIPLLVIGVFVWLIGGAVIRRRRDSALNSA